MSFSITDIRSVKVEDLKVGDCIYFKETDWCKERAVVIENISLSPKGKILINKTECGQLLCLLPGQKQKICFVNGKSSAKDWFQPREYGGEIKPTPIDPSDPPAQPPPDYTVSDLRRDLEGMSGDTKIMITTNWRHYAATGLDDIFKTKDNYLEVDFCY